MSNLDLTVDEAATLLPSLHPRSVPTKTQKERWDQYKKTRNHAENKVLEFLKEEGYWSND